MKKHLTITNIIVVLFLFRSMIALFEGDFFLMATCVFVAAFAKKAERAERKIEELQQRLRPSADRLHRHSTS